MLPLSRGKRQLLARLAALDDTVIRGRTLACMVPRHEPTRRTAILDATITQLVARGVGSFRVQDVAEALAISTGLVHYHFATKEALIAEALAARGDADLELARAIADGNRTPRARLTDVLIAYGPTGSAVGWRIWIDGWSEALRSDVIREVMHRLDHAWMLLVARLVQENQDAGLLTTAEPNAISARLLALMDGLSVRRVLSAPSQGARVPVFDGGDEASIDLIEQELDSLSPRNPVG